MALCAHEGCRCDGDEGDGVYCSDYCRRHGSAEGHKRHECKCGHDHCHPQEATPAEA